MTARVMNGDEVASDVWEDFDLEAICLCPIVRVLYLSRSPETPKYHVSSSIGGLKAMRLLNCCHPPASLDCVPMVSNNRLR